MTIPLADEHGVIDDRINIGKIVIGRDAYEELINIYENYYYNIEETVPYDLRNDPSYLENMNATIYCQPIERGL